MSTANNNIVRSVARKSLFESAKALLSTSISWNQGDLLRYNSSSNALEPLSSDANATSLCGVAVTTVVSGKAPSAYVTAVDASQAISDAPGPVYGVICKFLLATGSTLDPGDPVYVDTDPQTVTGGGSNSIGTYQGSAIVSSPSGTYVEVLVGARQGMSSLSF